MEYPELTLAQYVAIHEGNFFDGIAKLGLKRRQEIDYGSMYHKAILNSPLVPGIVDSIRELSQDFEMSIISGNDSGAIREFLALHGILSHFKMIWGSDHEKSKVEKFRTAFKFHKITACDTVYITDIPGDIKEAREVGVGCIAVTWGFCPREMLLPLNPLAIVESPSSLVDIVKKQF